MTFFATFSFDGCVCAPENDDQHSVHTILSEFRPIKRDFPSSRCPSTIDPLCYNKYQDLPLFEDILIN